MFDDRIPEEREERHKKLIALLRRGLREPVGISSPEQSQIIARVRERLRQGDDPSPRLEEMPVQQPGQTRSGPIVSISSRRGHVPRFVIEFGGCPGSRHACWRIAPPFQVLPSPECRAASDRRNRADCPHASQRPAGIHPSCDPRPLLSQ